MQAFEDDHDVLFEDDEDPDDGFFPLPGDDADDDPDDDPQNAANGYFAAHHRRPTKSVYKKRAFSDLPGGDPKALTEEVHKLLEAPMTLAEPVRKTFTPKYPEWLSLLHSTFSLLLHGVGSKKELIEDFVSGVNKESTPVVVLHGYSSGARVRDLLLTLLTQVLKVPAPTGSTRQLCKQLRQAFALSAAPPPASSPSGVEQLVLRLVPTPDARVEMDQAQASAIGSGMAVGPKAPLKDPALLLSSRAPASSKAPASASGASATPQLPMAAAVDALRGAVEGFLARDTAAAPVAAPPSLSASAAGSSGAIGAVGLAGEEEEAEEATAEAEAVVRSETILTPSGVQGATKRERRALLPSSRKRQMASVLATESPQCFSGPGPGGGEHGGTSPSEEQPGSSGSGGSQEEVGEDGPPSAGPIGYRLRALRQRNGLEPNAEDDGLGSSGGGNRARAADRTAAIAGDCRAPAHVYVVVHSIDGQALRSEESQALLAEIARIPQIHMVASCSHRNAAVLWDAKKARAFNWAWREAATNISYTHEATDSIHELLGCLYETSVGQQGLSAQLVLGHLTSNAQKLFKLLINYQLDNPRAAGLSFSELYQKARSNFLATSEGSLRKHITEFTTHDLVRKRSGPGGQEVFFCHFPRETLIALQAGAPE